jgi:hypothetical protein
MYQLADLTVTKIIKNMNFISYKTITIKYKWLKGRSGGNSKFSGNVFINDFNEITKNNEKLDRN